MPGDYKYKIEPRDVDSTLRAKIASVADFLMQAANDDADKLGFGVKDLNENNHSWVLSRFAAEIERIPNRNEEISIYTWVSEYGRLVTTRNMIVTDINGDKIGACVTNWAMIDLATRRALDLSELQNKSKSIVDRPSPIEPPRKVRKTTGAEALDTSSHRVVYSDIDFNGHVTSMKYFEWMLDTLPAGVLESTQQVRFDINYVHEIRLGDVVTILRTEEPGEGVHRFDIHDPEGNSICRAVTAFKLQDTSGGI